MTGRATRGPKAEDVLGLVTLVTGKEEFLNERTIVALRDAVRRHDAEAELSETQASGLTLAELGELSAPSLFSTTRCVVVRGLENLPDASAEGLLGYAADPAEDVALVLVHGGGPKGSGVLTKLRKLPTVTEEKSAELRPSEFPQLAAAAHQLTSDFPGERLSEDKVRRYFAGRAEAKSFAVADAAFAGRPRQAL